MIVPCIIIATVHKEAIESKVGVVLKFDDSSGAVMVTKILSGSKFLSTPLCAGDQCLAINGETNFTNEKQAIDVIKKATGDVTIVATTDEIPMGTKLAFGKKSAIQNDIGIRFGKVRDALVRVKSIDTSGPFSDTPIKVGDICLSVNGVPVSDPRRAANLIRIAETDFPFVLFLCASDLREKAIQWLGTQYRGNQLKVTWTSSDECKMKICEHGLPPLTLLFGKDFICEDTDMWDHLADMQKHPKHFHKHYTPFMKQVQEMNKVICEKKMAAVEAAVEYASDVVADAGDAGEFLTSLKEVVDLHKEGMLDDTEFKAAKRKLLGLGVRDDHAAVAVALPTAM